MRLVEPPRLGMMFHFLRVIVRVFLPPTHHFKK